MSNNKKRKCLIGGADLECVFWCEKLGKEIIFKLIKICQSYQFVKNERHYLLGYGSDPIEPLFDFSSENEFHKMKEYNINKCILNMKGAIMDVKTPLSIFVDYKNNFISISVPEDFLWDFSDDLEQANFLRLLEFSRLCEDLSNVLSPILGYLGTEVFQERDIAVLKIENSEAIQVDKHFFSEKKFRDLFNWYINKYVQRWSKNN